MKKTKLKFSRKGEAGNVLFLILIAVALFAALSYAVTQSTRSGAGDTASETNLISSAQLTQYSAGIRTSVVRMLIGGVALEDLAFNDPSDFAAGGAIGTNEAYRRRAVFHPQGGNATFQLAPKAMVSDRHDSNLPYGTWYYNANVQIQNIGMTDASTPDGNDLVAWLPHISRGVCRRMNDELGISSPSTEDVPVSSISSDEWAETLGIDMGDFPTGSGQPILSGDGHLVGQPFGCFKDDDDVLVYYHVLVER